MIKHWFPVFTFGGKGGLGVKKCGTVADDMRLDGCKGKLVELVGFS